MAGERRYKYPRGPWRGNKVPQAWPKAGRDGEDLSSGPPVQPTKPQPPLGGKPRHPPDRPRLPVSLPPSPPQRPLPPAHRTGSDPRHRLCIRSWLWSRPLGRCSDPSAGAAQGHPEVRHVHGGSQRQQQAVTEAQRAPLHGGEPAGGAVLKGRGGGKVGTTGRDPQSPLTEARSATHPLKKFKKGGRG